WCQQNEVAVCIYWPLLKGLLAGRLARDHQFVDADGRKKYPMFQGAEWQRNQDFMDELKQIACEAGHDLPAMVIAWTIRQPGITSALCGAKRAWQIKETAAGGRIQLSDTTMSRIQIALQRRTSPQSTHHAPS
ncbi:MAG: aldo/keto reductase, partial [Planctomyces sp.]|nr:aldo/keto reductase [Planctomyces sp.]